MNDCGNHDVGQVIVNEAIPDLPSYAFTGHNPGRLEDPQVLTHQRLRRLQRFGDLVYVAWGFVEMQHNCDSDRSGEDAKQLPCRADDGD